MALSREQEAFQSTYDLCVEMALMCVCVCVCVCEMVMMMMMTTL